jgi:hypothetical protein
MSWLGLGISDKKIFPTEFRLFHGTEILGIPFRTLPWKRKQLGIPFRVPKIEANFHNSLPSPFSGRENNLEFRSVKRNRSKFLEFPSEPFIGRENNSEFRSVELKLKNSRNSVSNHSAEKKTTRSKTRQRQSLTVFKWRVLVEAIRYWTRCSR